MKYLALTSILLAGPVHALCGDCNADGAVNILDALGGAQQAAGTIMLPPGQLNDCDVDSSTTVDVLDALVIAQFAAGLPVSLNCIVLNTPPVVTIDYFPPDDAGIVPFYYTLADAESDSTDVTFEFSTDGGATWAPATAQVGLTLVTVSTGLATSPSGNPHFFFWDSVADARTTSGPVMIRAWGEDALAAGAIASDTVNLANGGVTTYTSECIMESYRHADMANIPIYVVLRSFSMASQVLQYGGSCQESHEIDRPAFDSTPLACTLSITFVNLLADSTHEWPIHIHTPAAYHCTPGPHEVIAVSRQLGGYVDSTPLDIVIF